MPDIVDRPYVILRQRTIAEPVELYIRWEDQEAIIPIGRPTMWKLLHDLVSHLDDAPGTDNDPA